MSKPFNVFLSDLAIELAESKDEIGLCTLQMQRNDLHKSPITPKGYGQLMREWHELFTNDHHYIAALRSN